MSDLDVAQYFQRADFVVLPYLAASGSAVASVALRYGKPIIASRVGGLTDVVEDGVSGVLVPPGDATALARAIMGATRDEARRLAIGVEEFKARCTWDTLCNTLLQRLP